MAKRVLSIEISRTLVKVSEVDFKTKNPKVHQCFTVRTPSGVYDDGVILQTGEFGSYLREKFAENKVKAKNVVFSLNSSRIANREVFIPFVKEKQIKSIVAANASDYFPVDLSGYQLAHNVLDTIEKDGQKQYKLLVLAVPKTVIDSYYELADIMGLTIEALDYSGNSILPVIRTAIGEEPTMIIKVDEHSTLLTVLQNRSVVLQRNLNSGADIAVESVQEIEAFGEGLTYDQALDLLRGKTLIYNSFDMEELPANDDAPEFADAKMELTRSLRPLVSSIVRVVDYYNSRNSENPIQRYLLTGFGGDFSGLSRLMSHEIDDKVLVLAHVDGISLDRSLDVNKVSFGEYIACIGAAIDPIDLIPDEKKKGGKKKAEASGGGNPLTADLSALDTTQVGIILFIVGILVAAGLAGYSFFKVQTASAENTVLRARVKELEPILLVYDEYTKAEAFYTDVATMYDVTRNNNEAIGAFVEELQEKMPSSIAMESINSDNNQVTMSMLVDSKEAVGEVVEQFRTFDSLSSILYTGSSETENDLGEICWQLTIVAYYNDALTNAANEMDAEEEAFGEEAADGEEMNEEEAETVSGDEAVSADEITEAEDGASAEEAPAATN